jgi:hypothetical protein
MFGVMMMGGVEISRAHGLAPVYLERILLQFVPRGWMDALLDLDLGFEFGR